MTSGKTSVSTTRADNAHCNRFASSTLKSHRWVNFARIGKRPQRSGWRQLTHEVDQLAQLGAFHFHDVALSQRRFGRGHDARARRQ